MGSGPAIDFLRSADFASPSSPWLNVDPRIVRPSGMVRGDDNIFAKEQQMRKSKWASLAVSAVFAVAAIFGIRALAEGPGDAEKSLAREGGPPPGDDRGPPPRDRGPRQFEGPPRGDFRPDDRGPRDD